MKRLPAIQFYEDTLGLLPASREGMWAAEGAPPPANPGAAVAPGLLEGRQWKAGWERLWDSRLATLARDTARPGEEEISPLNPGQAPACRRNSHGCLPLLESPKIRIWGSPRTLQKGSLKSPSSHTYPLQLRSLIHEPQTSCLYTQPMGPLLVPAGLGPNCLWASVGVGAVGMIPSPPAQGVGPARARVMLGQAVPALHRGPASSRALLPQARAAEIPVTPLCPQKAPPSPAPCPPPCTASQVASLHGNAT